MKLKTIHSDELVLIRFYFILLGRGLPYILMYPTNLLIRRRVKVKRNEKYH